MPRYFFHIIKDSHSPDIVGVELADLDTARREATRVMGEELKFKPGLFWDDQDWRIEVTDDDGLILFAIYSTAIASAAAPR